jgi:RNA polymerase sigma-70 factor, ECF subfamily
MLVRRIRCHACGARIVNPSRAMFATEMSGGDALEQQRERLFAIAYGMLGTTAEAEDVVQEAFARWHEADRSAVRSPAAFLTTVATRLAIDRLRSAERRRVEYVGPWLPEPPVSEFDPADVVAEAERLSLALLATLERLNPVERAVFLLRDVFDFDYSEIAETVGKEEANCRQIARRARARVGEPVSRHRATREEEDELLRAFVAAAESGEVQRLAGLLARDAVLWTDGGGRVKAARKPVYGAEKIARFLTTIAGREPAGTRRRPVRVNGDPGLRTDTTTGPRGVVALELAEGLIVGIRIVVNPDKLRDLTPGEAGRREARAAPWSARPARWIERHLLNPQMRFTLRLGLAPRTFALLETTGRRTGRPRRTPVGNGLLGDTFWLVCEHGRTAGYVRNIERNPRVRVKVGRGWRAGTAQILDDDDPFARLDTLAAALGPMRRLDAAILRCFVRLLDSQPVTVRIDLEPPGR